MTSAANVTEGGIPKDCCELPTEPIYKEGDGFSREKHRKDLFVEQCIHTARGKHRPPII